MSLVGWPLEKGDTGTDSLMSWKLRLMVGLLRSGIKSVFCRSNLAGCAMLMRTGRLLALHWRCRPSHLSSAGRGSQALTLSDEFTFASSPEGGELETGDLVVLSLDLERPYKATSHVLMSRQPHKTKSLIKSNKSPRRES